MKVISRPFYIPKWDVSTSEPAEIPAEPKVFFRSVVNVTMPHALLSSLYGWQNIGNGIGMALGPVLGGLIWT